MAFVKRERREAAEKPERRRFLITAAKAGVSALVLEPLLGCTREFYARAPERAVYLDNNHTPLSAQDLGFMAGETMPEDAAEIMRSRGLTNVVSDTNSSRSMESVTALTADYQRFVHLFKNRRYEQSVELDIPAGERPHRYALRVADYGNKKMILVLIRDAITDSRGFGIEPPRLALIPYNEGKVEKAHYSQLRRLERARRGMQYPLFVGYDLEAGITFIARNNRGMPWEEGYVVTWDGERLRGRPVSFFDLMRCDCVSEWARQRE